MKLLLLAVMTLPMIGTTMNTPHHGQSKTASAPTKNAVAFACEMRALTPAQRRRHSEVLLPALKSARLNTRELKNGYAFQFPPDAKTFALVSEWIGDERLCCPFFEFDVHVGNNSAPIVLMITGPEGVKQFIRAELSEMVG